MTAQPRVWEPDDCVARGLGSQMSAQPVGLGSQMTAYLGGLGSQMSAQPSMQSACSQLAAKPSTWVGIRIDS